MRMYFKSRYQEIPQKNFPKGVISLSQPKVIKKPSHQKQKSVGKINCGMRHKMPLIMEWVDTVCLLSFKKTREGIESKMKK